MPSSTQRIQQYGEITEKKIQDISNSYKNAIVDTYVIMPNHIHIIIEIKDKIEIKGSMRASIPTISQIINTLKNLITKQIGFSIFQRNYYEHIIRNEKEYLKIREYIINNPINWEKDEYINKRAMHNSTSQAIHIDKK